MIKWNCNFSIEDSTVQVPVAIIKIENYKNSNSTCTVLFNIFDDSETILVKKYERVYSQNFNSDDEIYLVEIKEFQDAELV